MRGGSLRGSEEGGMIMGEEKEKGMYCHSMVCQRGADEGGGNGEELYKIRRRVQIRGSGLIETEHLLSFILGRASIEEQTRYNVRYRM